jgi:maltose alpha-D-glucosyltransferase/alpha-amylase
MHSAAALPVLELTGGWETVLEGAARQELEHTALPHFLRGQRWFGGKAREVRAARVVDGAEIPAGPGRALLALVQVDFADGGSDLYFLPLTVSSGTAAAGLLQSMRSRAVARLTGPGGEALLHDALADDDVCAALLDMIAGGRDFPTRAGCIRAFRTAAFRQLRGPDDLPLPARRGPQTSSNSLIHFGRRLLLKLFRRLECGTNPEFEVGRFLTERSSFTRIPQVASAVEYHRPGSDPMTLAILQALVPNQGDGWGHALEELGRCLERVQRQAHRPDPAPDERPLVELAAAEPPPAAREMIGAYLDAAATLGRRTAELHRALAADPYDPAFAPEPMTEADLAALVAEVADWGEQALVGLREQEEDLAEAFRPAARQLLEEGPAVLDHLAGDPGIRPGALKIRCHGDYHLGQVLWADNDFVILDFEGEPARSVAARRAKQSPLKDVAGMLRSFNYAAYAGLFAFTRDRPDDLARLEPWAELWQQWTAAAFLYAYRAAAAGAPFVPTDPAQFILLLDIFMLNKAFYELLYELNNRPEWVRIPLRGILSLLAACRLAPGPR